MQYDKEFKLQALELSDEIGVKAAADQLGIILLPLPTKASPPRALR